MINHYFIFIIVNLQKNFQKILILFFEYVVYNSSIEHKMLYFVDQEGCMELEIISMKGVNLRHCS